MPKLLLISGSLRGGSTNSATLRTAAALAPDGIEAEIYDGMGRLPHFNPDDDPADGVGVDPEVAALRGGAGRGRRPPPRTPEYAGALPGSFKNLLDWTVGGGQTYGMPVAWINVSGAAAPSGGADAHDSLRKVLGFTGAEIIEARVLRLPLARDDVGERRADRAARGARGDRRRDDRSRGSRPLTPPAGTKQFKDAVSESAPADPIETTEDTECAGSEGALLASPAAHQFDPNQEPDRGGADDQLLFVLLDLAAPVGHFGDFAAQRFDVGPQRQALGVDVAADLLGRAAGLAGAEGRPAWGSTLICSSLVSISLVSFASSIAWVGTGGEPALTAL